MGAQQFVQFLIDDHGDKGSGFRQTFAEDLPYGSLLQRSGKTVDELLEMCDWTDDDTLWCKEYDKGKESDMEKQIRYRRRTYFDICAWRELKEDFGRGDVSCMRDMRVPFVTSRSPLRAMKDEFDE